MPRSDGGLGSVIYRGGDSAHEVQPVELSWARFNRLNYLSYFFFSGLVCVGEMVLLAPFMLTAE